MMDLLVVLLNVLCREMEDQFILRVPPSIAEQIERLLNEDPSSSEDKLLDLSFSGAVIPLPLEHCVIDFMCRANLLSRLGMQVGREYWNRMALVVIFTLLFSLI